MSEKNSGEMSDSEKVRALQLCIDAHREADEDVRRLVRELDVMMNGDGAAEQASLCDLVSQFSSWKAGQLSHMGELEIIGRLASCRTSEDWDAIPVESRGALGYDRRKHDPQKQLDGLIVAARAAIGGAGSRKLTRVALPGPARVLWSSEPSVAFCSKHGLYVTNLACVTCAEAEKEMEEFIKGVLWKLCQQKRS